MVLGRCGSAQFVFFAGAFALDAPIAGGIGVVGRQIYCILIVVIGCFGGCCWHLGMAGAGLDGKARHFFQRNIEALTFFNQPPVG